MLAGRGFRNASGVQADRIFVRAPNWVGDLVMATAAFARIRAGFPQAEIVCGLRPYLRSLLAGTEHFDDYMDMPRAGGARGLLRQAAALRRRRFDLAIVFPNSLESGLAAWLAGIPRRLGYKQGRPFLMNLGTYAAPARGIGKLRARRTPEPMPEYYRKLLDVLELPPGPARGALVVTGEEQSACEAWLEERGVGRDRLVVAINAGASYGASKLWEPDRFAAVARVLRERRGAAVVLLSGPAEVDMVRGIARQSGAVAAVDPVLPLGMLKPLVARSSLLITTDSGPRHVAVALGVPVVCLMGPNDPRYTAYCLEKTALIRKELPCSPCNQKVCPLGHRHCMTLIEVDEVVAAAEGLLAASG